MELNSDPVPYKKAVCGLRWEALPKGSEGIGERGGSTEGGYRGMSKPR